MSEHGIDNLFPFRKNVFQIGKYDKFVEFEIGKNSEKDLQ